ncbi:hypothetical protein [Salarchaeum sp. JOR-1]|uniref:hypothetical protein n=1 Tax=Salarchaeum sp. JOR-1 TaxID=2599399 RepID=UPI001198650B|nr:hypothetical protein [Salarchaeum sp. JOR-1]QDX39754.1 hypothetical protein FQU85_02145 [Salarchaeum sp. JOR-1]
MTNPPLRVQLPVVLVVFVAGYLLFGVLTPVSPLEAAVMVSLVFLPIHYVRLVYSPEFDYNRFADEEGWRGVVSAFALVVVLVFVVALALAFVVDAAVSANGTLRLVAMVGLPALVAGLLGSRVVSRLNPEYVTPTAINTRQN